MRMLISPAQMYALEKSCFSAGLSSPALMRHAAGRLAEAFEFHFGSLSGRRIAVACGRGNNGGDGYAFAEIALKKGARVEIAAACPIESLSGDALICARSAVQSGVVIRAEEEISPPEIWIDALFGIGLSRPVSGREAALIERINADHARGSRVLAVDAPSGLNLSSGRMMGECVWADVTVTFEYAKIGHYLSDGLDVCGRVDVRPIELARSPEKDVSLVETQDAVSVLPVRRRNIHKGTCGHLLIVAGSVGMAGAAQYAARMALRMGTGLVTLACPESIVPVLQTLVPGAMALPLPEADGALCECAVPKLLEALSGKSAVVIGPGLSRRASPRIVETVLKSPLPAVIDADALNLISEHRHIQSLLADRHVLTPHPGEAARLLGTLSSPVEDARRLSQLGAVALLKGASSVIAGAENTYISASGSGGMATGGSGDVLSGMIGSLLAQGVPPETAAWAGSALHGLCGETAAGYMTETAMTAADLIDFWPQTLKKLCMDRHI